VRLVLADDVPGESEARAFTDFPVKLVIETMKTHRIFGFHCLALDFQYLVERRVILAGQDPAGRAHGFRFKRIAHEAGLKHGGGGNLRDQRRPLRADGKKAELGETIERVPHRLARHAQRLGHLDLGHLGPGGSSKSRIWLCNSSKTVSATEGRLSGSRVRKEEDTGMRSLR
jgi:hypothetical protein